MRALLQSVAFAAAWVAVSGAVALCQPAPATSPGAGARKSPPSIRLLIGDIVGQQSHKDAPGSVEPDIGRFQGALASIAMADGEHVWTRCQHDQEFENVHFMDEENLTPKLDSQSLETLRKNQIDYFVLLLFSQNAGKLRVTARLEKIAPDNQWNIVAPSQDFLPDPDKVVYATLAQEVYQGIAQDRGRTYRMYTAPVKFCSAAAGTRADVKDVPGLLLERFRKHFMEQQPWYIGHAIEAQCSESGDAGDGAFSWWISVREEGTLLYFHVKMKYGTEVVCEDDSPRFDSPDKLMQQLDQAAADMVGRLRLDYDGWTPSQDKGKPSR